MSEKEEKIIRAVALFAIMLAVIFMAARNDVEQEERKEQQYDKAYYQALKKICRVCDGDV